MKFMQNGGSWRGWLLGIVATLIASLIGSGILFQRDTREQLAQHTEQIKNLEKGVINIVKYLSERIDRLERHIDELEKKNAR